VSGTGPVRGNQHHDGDNRPGDPAVTARLGPWSFRTCVTAACTRCAAVPLDEDTGIAPHFASVPQAADELARDWGWEVVTRSGQWHELLCPACAADVTSHPAPPACSAAIGRGPQAAPWWQKDGRDPHSGRRAANLRLPPPAGHPGEGG
jgi:hypothetical protein